MLFIGSYAEAEGPGVYVYELQTDTGELRQLDQVSGLKNPTFLNVDEQNQRLYALTEAAVNGGKGGAAASYQIDISTGKLRELSREVNLESTTCHINRDADNKYLVVSSYHGGTVGLVALNGDGTIGELVDTKQHTGHGADPERQDKPHVHSAFFSPDGRFLFVSDLGIDIVRAYTINEANRTLEFHADTHLPPGSGPRHLAFHPSAKYVYVINEVNSTIAAFSYNQEEGRLTALEVVPTLPEDFQGENTTAEITVSQDGRYLYGSNRGHDSIVVYSINQDSGTLTYVEHVSTEGGHPRHFALTPDGSLLIAANRDSNNLAVFRVNKETGQLTFTGQTAKVSKPVCVKPVQFS
ncbi:lactonase family protein [Paenibacillus sp. YPG26]|uniref:lactonase family protein n=1 Tax=Paenibacillus sp. YPG26 TaxID=2878915 RepID=UPI00203D9519|nr:lactonase family protein [Paenibacillus sp. YPG26]USB35094.1 lactonase family protein [Paenibacillus sp. YPG26]